MSDREQRDSAAREQRDSAARSRAPDEREKAMTMVKDLMTPDPIVLESTESVLSAAQRMRDADVGAVLVENRGHLSGIVTDRDLVVRAMADGLDPEEVTLGQTVSQDLVTLNPDDTIGDAIGVMREHAIRRIPVVEDGAAVGILSLGDLAESRDPESVLGEISAAPPNQ
jgi:CBS domain-containing protein